MCAAYVFSAVIDGSAPQEQGQPSAHLGETQLFQITISNNRTQNQRITVSESSTRLASREKLVAGGLGGIGLDEAFRGHPVDGFVPTVTQLLHIVFNLIL